MKTIFENIQQAIAESGERLALDAKTVAHITTPYRIIEHTTDVPGVGKVDMYRVQFNNALGPYKGGIRFHPEVNIDEVKALSITMMLKCSLAGIPLGGAKGGATINPKELTAGQLESVARAWMQTMHPYLGVDQDIPAPDVNTNGQTMAWMLDEYETIYQRSEPGMITGKPLSLGGSEGRVTATSQGGVYALLETLATFPLKGDTKEVIIQGFGNVGSFAATILFDAGFTITGISDSSGAIYRATGLNPHEIVAIKEQKQSLKDWAEAHDGVSYLTNEALLIQPCDILIPAALEGVITEDNAQSIQASHILELANNPTTSKADQILKEKGIIVIPDFLANAGGVTVSYFEWVQNRQQYYWKVEKVDEELKEIMTKATRKVVARSLSHSLSLREAGIDLAVSRIAEAVTLRGK